MTQQSLMLIEISGIQDYIFRSNQLAQNIGASELVQRALKEWLSELLPRPHNFEGARLPDKATLSNGLASLVIYSGGGNAAVLFASDEMAERFARDYSRRLLRDAPGMQMTLQRMPFDPVSGILAKIHQELRGRLARRKLDRKVSAPLAGLGVTAACVYTGAPAVCERNGQLISAEVRAKLDAEPYGNERLKKLLPDVETNGFKLTHNFGDFGTKGESSFLAIVHADGNRMGDRIENIGRKFPRPGLNDDYIKALGDFSDSVHKASEKALQETAGLLLSPDNLPEGSNLIGGIVPIPERNGERYLPFRPIVFGGDDVTFVCEGRLGLSLAAEYLSAYSGETLSDGEPAHARAGVAVVKSHYPFSRAYELAVSLCDSAREYIRDCEEKGEQGVSAFDWHFAVTGLLLPLSEVREREYTAREGSLLMRPVRLNPAGNDWRSWVTFTRVIDGFRDDDGAWAGRRNKLKALRDVLREGPEDVKLFLAGEKLPSVPSWPDMRTQGWQGENCGYFDAVEALDFYVPLNGSRPE